MSPYLSLFVLVGYFGLLALLAWWTGRKADQAAFFTANKSAPWFLVAFGMIGTSLSGVTFISVPGAVKTLQFSYFQMVLGYLLGYLVIATVLMPMYYRLKLVSIYAYLEQRFGAISYKTGSGFFLVSRTLGSSVRMYLAVIVLQLAIFDPLNIPFEIAVLVAVGLVFLYTMKGGIKTIIFTDTLQTFFLITAVILTLVLISGQLDWSAGRLISEIKGSDYSQIFVWELGDKHYFWKDFFSGAFIAIVMTGLDQDLMQKNLTLKNIGDAQKNMFWFCIILVIVNFLFLCLGALLYLFAAEQGIDVPAKTDQLYPMLALDGSFGLVVGVVFLLGITAATYSSSDSAMTALTTAFCYDFLGFGKASNPQSKRVRTMVHAGFAFLFVVVILILRKLNNDEVITLVFEIASYTYGPLLGLFAFGLFTKLKPIDTFVPLVAILGPLATYGLVELSKYQEWTYQFGFEKLIINGAIVFLGLLILSILNTSSNGKYNSSR